jgi:hypothetical protein
VGTHSKGGEQTGGAEAGRRRWSEAAAVGTLEVLGRRNGWKRNRLEEASRSGSGGWETAVGAVGR